MLADWYALAAAHRLSCHERPQIVGVDTLPCYGEGCPDETRRLFEQALKPV